MEDMARIVTVAEAETGFGELLRQVAEGHEAVVVEEGGEPRVVILSPSEYSRLKAGQRIASDWRRQVDQAREMIAAELGGRRLPPAEEILRRARDERDAQLLDLR